MKESDYLIKIGENIRTIRLEKKISQVELAAQCNFEKANMRRIEAGRTNPTAITLIKIAKALNIEVSALFDFKEKK